MTAPDFAYLDERLHAARAELNDALEQASRELSRFKRENQPTEEERRQLQQAALRGDLGEEMQQLARKVENREDTWDAVFSGKSPNAHLLQGHLTRMLEANREAIIQAIEDDPDMDPSVPPDELGNSATTP
ncbi:MAG TPA: hypothetical protein DGT23_11115 [Micromonosporaceae bacterium]|nr:hypothetical protein [Micromonosporaceae bacterium]